MYKNNYPEYSKKLKKNIELIKSCNEKNEILRILKRRDPDSKAVRTEFNIKCTADGLLSINDICKFESSVPEIINTYEKYRKVPIIFFPSERGGINSARSGAYGRRIDYALFDIKMYFEEKQREYCKLKKTFEARTGKKGNVLNKTNTWVKTGNMDSFEKMIDWWDVKGIFTDDEYNVYDISSKDHKTITDFSQIRSKGDEELDFYNNLKKCIEVWYKRQGIEL